MKLFILFYSLINLTFFANVRLEDYQDRIHQGYEFYEVLIEEQNQYYTLNITWGVNKNQINYSVYFYNDKPNHLSLRVIRNDYSYNLPSDSRGDIVVESFSVDNTESLFIVLLDRDNHLYRTVNLPLASDKAEFLLRTNEFIVGENKGLKTINLKQIYNPSKVILLVVGLFVIIFLSIIAILILYVTKTGVFRKKDQVINEPMQEYYQDLERTLRRFAEEAQLTIERMQSTEMVEENKKEITDEPTQVYKRLLRYEFEDDSEILFDIKKHLQDKGFITDYHLLSEEEKNLIMVELMILRDQKIISIDQYNQEVIRLWQKSV